MPTFFHSDCHVVTLALKSPLHQYSSDARQERFLNVDDVGIRSIQRLEESRVRLTKRWSRDGRREGLRRLEERLARVVGTGRGFDEICLDGYTH